MVDISIPFYLLWIICVIGGGYLIALFVFLVVLFIPLILTIGRFMKSMIKKKWIKYGGNMEIVIPFWLLWTFAVVIGIPLLFVIGMLVFFGVIYFSIVNDIQKRITKKP